MKTPSVKQSTLATIRSKRTAQTPAQRVEALLAASGSPPIDPVVKDWLRRLAAGK